MRFLRAMASGPGLAAVAALLLGVAGLLQNVPAIAAPFLVMGAGLTFWAQRRSVMPPPTPPAPPVRVTPQGKAWNIPAPVTNFAGRDADLETMGRMLEAAGRLGVVAVHGLGGVGKTQVTRAYAHRRQLSVGWQIQAASRLTVVADLASLATQLGLPAGRDAERSARAALQELANRRDWLLIYDNASDPETIADLLPTNGAGQVLITSRHPRWEGVATTLATKPFTTETSATFLQSEVDDDDAVSATALAQELGGLPLALAQAAAYCRHPRTRLAAYLEVYRKQPIARLSEYTPPGYPEPVARTWLLNMRTATRTPAAVQLLRLMAFLAPVDLPRDVITEAAAVLPRQLRHAAADPVLLHRTIGVLTDMSLVTADSFDSIRVHQLVQEVTRAQIATTRTKFMRRIRGRDVLSHTSPASIADWAHVAVLAMERTFPSEGREERLGHGRCSVLLPHAQAALDHLEAKSSHPPATLLEHNLGLHLADLGKYQEAAQKLKLTSEALSANMGECHPTTLMAINCLTETLRLAGDLKAAYHLHVKTIPQFERTFGTEHPTTLMAMNNYAEVLHYLGMLEAAQRIHEQVLSLRKLKLGPDHPATLTTINNLAGVLRNQGDISAARILHEQELETCRRVLGEEHPDTLISMHNLSNVLQSLGDLDRAFELHSNAHRTRISVLGKEHPHTITSIAALAGVLAAKGDLRESIKLYEQAANISRRVLGNSHRDTITIVSNLASALLEANNNRAAYELFKEVLRVSQSNLGDNHPDTLVAMSNLATTLAALGNFDRASKIFERIGLTLTEHWPTAPNLLISYAVMTNQGSVGPTLAISSFFKHATGEGKNFAQALRKAISMRETPAADGLSEAQLRIIEAVIRQLSDDATKG